MTTEKLLVEEVASASREVRSATRGLHIGDLIRTIRKQLGMSQLVLAKRAGVPQSTISRIESGERDMNLSTLQKILSAISCDLILAPLLKSSIDDMRRKRARKVAKKRMQYLEGTMNLEEQQPDPRFMEMLLKEEEEHLLQGPGSKLWEE
ncbi:MAG: helix-turn-helix domain-containing protein [Candidatus Algichlamydia australiensis]|nr:helix-turn-helix domain-containing protein [Chlamydiales bacterium]